MASRSRHADSNHLLSRLPAACREELTRWSRVEQVGQGTVLTRRLRPVTHAWFPHAGLISLTVSTEEGHMAEVASIGREGGAGLEAAFEASVALSDSVVQIGGEFSIIRTEHLRAVTAAYPPVASAVARHGQALTAQLEQSVACNALHRLEQRCCRWLITAHGRSGADELPLTQEALAGLLGAGRPGVSLVLRSLERAGLIRRRRGRIIILEPGGIHAHACECHDNIGRVYARLGLGAGIR
jgi:CRP-like cAMP-binding protein